MGFLVVATLRNKIRRLPKIEIFEKFWIWGGSGARAGFLGARAPPWLPELQSVARNRNRFRRVSQTNPKHHFSRGFGGRKALGRVS